MIKRFLHQEVTVTDMAKTVAMYEALGMKEVERLESPAPKALLVVMEDHQGTGVELWQFMDTDHPWVKIIEGHTAYETDSIEEDAAMLLKKGFTEAIPLDEDDTFRFILLQAPDGKVIELCQYKNPK